MGGVWMNVVLLLVKADYPLEKGQLRSQWSMVTEPGAFFPT